MQGTVGHYQEGLVMVLRELIQEIRLLRSEVRDLRELAGLPTTNGSTFKAILEELQKHTEILEKIKGPIFEAKPAHWYETGLRTAPNVPSDENATGYDFHNIINALGYPAMEGTIMNFGPGNIYVRFARSPHNISKNETVIPANSSLEWTTDDRYAIYYFYIRADEANTIYQVVCG